MLRAVLLDVGGTLWPEGQIPAEHETRLQQIARAYPSLERSQVQQLIDALDAGAAAWDEDLFLTQDSYALVEGTLERLGLPGLDPLAVRQAMRVKAPEGILFKGAQELLHTIKQLGLACAVVSNTAWRTAADYAADFETLGIGSSIDAIITSLDVGYRKPHKAMFETALEALGSPPDAALMIGDSELKDIDPARELGMRTLLVAPQRPLGETSRAAARGTSLGQARKILEAMARS